MIFWGLLVVHHPDSDEIIIMTKNIYTIINFLAIAAIITIGVDSFYLIFEAKLEQPYFEKPTVTKKWANQKE